MFDNIYFNLTQKFVSNVQRSNALEIVDNMVDKDIRPIIVPLIESRDNDEKLRLGYQYFKIKQLTIEETLETLMVDDSDWVRAITMYALAEEKFVELSDKISMFMYDPAPIVRESAVYAMEKFEIKMSPEDINYLKEDPDVFIRRYVEFITGTADKDTA